MVGWGLEKREQIRFIKPKRHVPFFFLFSKKSLQKHTTEKQQEKEMDNLVGNGRGVFKI
jgi:hypothetical protein